MKSTENNSQRNRRKIIICTTFREFNGNSNDWIQRVFLGTLKKQTYQNYILVATTFGEENVEKVLAEENIPHITVAGEADQYRFSSTQVLENGINIIDKPESYIIIWTTCDDLFDETFFEKLVSELLPLSAYTSLPHIVYKNVEDYKMGKVGSYCYGGIDTVCFDADIFLIPEVREVIHKYQNKGWGFFEYFLSGVGKVFCKEMINLWPTKIARIDNDRSANNETRAYFDLTSSHNAKTYGEFKHKYSIKGDVYSSIFYYKTPMKYAGIKLRTFLRITEYRLKNKFAKKIIRFLPRSLKDLLKKIFVLN